MLVSIETIIHRRSYVKMLQKKIINVNYTNYKIPSFRLRWKLAKCTRKLGAYDGLLNGYKFVGFGGVKGFAIATTDPPLLGASYVASVSSSTMRIFRRTPESSDPPAIARCCIDSDASSIPGVRSDKDVVRRMEGVSITSM